MRNVVVCTKCGMQLSIPDVAAGQLIQCPGCAAVFSPTDQPVTGASQEAGGRAIVWVLTAVVGLASIAAGVFAWYVAHGARSEENLAAEVKNPIADALPQQGPEESGDPASDTPAVLPQKDSNEADHQLPSKKEEQKPDRKEPQKELAKIDNSKIDAPKQVESKKELPKQVEPPRVAPPKDEIVIQGDGWFEVHCVQGRFRVTLPALPLAQPLQEPDSKNAGPGYTAAHPTEELVFRAGSIEPSGDLAAGAWEGFLIPAVKYDLGAMQFTTKKEIRQDGHDGWSFLAATNKARIGVAGRFFHLRDISGKSRLFLFTVVGPHARLDSPDVRRFFKSIQLENDHTTLAKGNDRPENPRGNTAVGEEKKVTDKKPLDLKKREPQNARITSPAPAGEVVKLAGKLNAHVGAVIDLDAQAALLLLRGGHAKLYAYPEFRPLASYKLGGGSAYRPVYERAKGRLFVLSPSPKTKDPVGKPGGSQVAMYEIRALLEGKFNSNAEIMPAKIISLGGFCSQLCLSPDGAWLYALQSANPKMPKVVRLDAATGEAVATLPVPEFTDRLVLARDGKTLFALAHSAARTVKGPPPEGTLLVITAQTMKLAKSINLPLDPFDLETTRESIVFVSGHGGVRSEIAVVDGAKEMPLIATWKGVPPNSSLKLSDDEKCLYVGNWKGATAAVAGLLLPGVLAGSDLPKAQWVQSPPVPARGEMIVTPDNQYLLCDSGVVFLLKSGD
jgi:hypothetical protein